MRKCDIDSLNICPPYLYNVAIFPLGKSKKSHFQQYYSYILQIIYVISEKNKQTVTPYPPHLKNVTALPCKMQNFYV